MTRLLKSLALIVSVVFLQQANAKPKLPDHWVGTWAIGNFDKLNQPKPDSTAPPLLAEDTTVRQIVHASIGGALVRVQLSNQFGTEPLTVSAVHIALPGENPGDISLISANALTFSGRPSITIPAGSTAVSDPVAITLKPLSDLVLSIFLPAQKLSHISQHGSSWQTNYLIPGNSVGTKALPTTAKKFTSYYFLKAVDVLASADSSSVVALGDSITDGAVNVVDSNGRWPDELARRLQANGKTKNIGVLNVGIGGNRVLHDDTGPSALARFDTDVLAQSGVKYLIILESINDIGHAYDPKKPYDVVTSDDLIAGLTQLVERAHTHNIQVFGATLTPYMGTGYSSPAGEVVRAAVNQWIRTTKSLDGVIDFESAAGDKATPPVFQPAFDHGDHLHPNDAGLKAMGAAIDLKLFTDKKK